MLNILFLYLYDSLILLFEYLVLFMRSKRLLEIYNVNTESGVFDLLKRLGAYIAK